jgi:hypothetical protein
MLLASCTTRADVAPTPGQSTQAIAPFVGFCAEALRDRWQNQVVAQRGGVTTCDVGISPL